jgi:hypothetical protein
MEMENRLTVHDLINHIPEWCREGALVELDKTSKEKEVGIIVEYCLIDPEEMENEEYQHLFEDNEWLLIYVCTQSEITDYYLDEVTPL